MFRRIPRLFAAPLALAALAVSGPVAADDSAVRSEIKFWMDDAEQKLLDLADAVPESKYSWRPAKGVRSIAEVYMHVATANFGIPSMLGVTAPEGFKFEGYETSMTKKAEVRKALKDSFDHMQSAFAKMSDEDLGQPAEFFGMKTTRRGALLLLLSHAHEHLGQSIAYARQNGVVPPWTAKQEAAAKAKEKEKESANK